MQFCLKESVQMKQCGRKGRFFTFSSTSLLYMSALLQTLRALWILPLNALQNIENHRVSCCLVPVQQQNPLAQNGWN